MKVLNFGSLNIDYVYSLDHFVQKGETISSDALNIFPGGKGLNQSLALGRAGVATIHAGAVGKDGEFLLKLLQESGVNIDYVQSFKRIKRGIIVLFSIAVQITKSLRSRWRILFAIFLQGIFCCCKMKLTRWRAL